MQAKSGHTAFLRQVESYAKNYSPITTQMIAIITSTFSKNRYKTTTANNGEVQQALLPSPRSITLDTLCKGGQDRKSPAKKMQII